MSVRLRLITQVHLARRQSALIRPGPWPSRQGPPQARTPPERVDARERPRP
ncbi:MAG: hypothetical protein J2P40_01460 [Candidatus Dormibacteraeota bacterium]|nr:hypothetical protein [Candidatus Dormibacteraeota bacterium]MBO0759917.1 hypothetical protein [Candidatus Dormibacteraeota bacterium]